MRLMPVLRMVVLDIKDSAEKRDKLVSDSSSRNCCSTLNDSVLGVGLSIPPLPAGKAALLSNFSNGKQSREVDDCPASCHSRSKVRTFAFRSREVPRLLSELDLHGGVDPLGFYLLLFRELASALAPKLSILFYRVRRVVLVPSQWCCAV